MLIYLFTILIDLTNEVLKAMQEYSICRTGVFSEKDRLTNISLENEKSTMMIRRYKEEIEEMDSTYNFFNFSIFNVLNFNFNRTSQLSIK